MKPEKNNSKRQGFTLVEIMIVVAIIGLLAAIGIPSFVNARVKSLENTRRANIRQIESGLNRYAMDTGQTNGTLVAWADVSAYLKDTTLANYTVGGYAIDESSLIVGGTVVYTAP